MRYSSNSTIRSQAFSTVRWHYERIIMMYFAIYAFSTTLSGLAMGSAFSNVLTQLTSALSSEMDPEKLIETFMSLPTLFTSGASGIVALINTAVTPLLNTGLLLVLIQMAEGKSPKASTLYCRWRHTLGCIGLPMWVQFKTMLWAIPGIVIVLIGLVLSVGSLAGAVGNLTSGEIFDVEELFPVEEEYEYADSYYYYDDYDYYGSSRSNSSRSNSSSRNSSASSADASDFFGVFITVIGGVVAAVMVIMASLRYAMAPYVFAEKPEIGVYDSVETSKSMMRGNMGKFFVLVIPYIVIGIASVLVYIGLCALLFAMEAGIFGAILMLLGLLAVIVLFVVLVAVSNMSVACFYNAHKPMPAEAPKAAEAV